jgi:hypothetical protein
VILTIAEEILLLAYREDTGKSKIGSIELESALGGAVLAELALKGRLDFEGTTVHVTDPAPVGDDELDAVLARIAGERKERKPEWWVGKLRSSKLRGRLLTRLAARGVLSEQQTKVFGLFPTRRYPELDPGPEQELRQRIESVLAGAEPDEHLAIVVAILHAAKLDRKAFPHASKKRIKEIAEGDRTGVAVRKTIASIHASIAAAGTAATIASTS